MNYESVISEMFQRFPELQTLYRSQFDYMEDEPPLQYLVFGSVLVPYLEKALTEGNLRVILQVCAFLEDASVSAQTDAGLEGLIRIEIGEWLNRAANEELLSPWLGSETKRICRYVPGLATQRLRLRAEERTNTVKSRLRRLFQPKQ